MSTCVTQRKLRRVKVTATVRSTPPSKVFDGPLPMAFRYEEEPR